MIHADERKITQSKIPGGVNSKCSNVVEQMEHELCFNSNFSNSERNMRFLCYGTPFQVILCTQYFVIFIKEMFLSSKMKAYTLKTFGEHQCSEGFVWHQLMLEKPNLAILLACSPSLFYSLELDKD